MSYIISVYGERAFKKILLPAVNNADYNAVLYREKFGLETDLVLEMEIVDGAWSFRKSDSYMLRQNGKDCFGAQMHSEDIIQLRTAAGSRLTLLIHESPDPFEVYHKYSLKNLRKVTIGKDAQNHICYDYYGLVSKNHAVLELRDGNCFIHDLSANGVFVNSRRAKKVQQLRFGDSIHIMGLQMIYLGDLLAVERGNASTVINPLVLQELKKEDLSFFAADSRKRDPEKTENPGKKEKEWFHRTPRNIEKIDDEPVEIEEPPAPGRMKGRSMLMAVGPAFTMALPMMLGSLMMVYGSSSSSIMMYSGLVTAIASALVGSIWGVANVKSAKKQAEQEEKERKTAYVEYLEKTMASVKEKYDRNTRILNTRYPEVNQCADYGRNTAALWNRNPHHEDFLYHRLGLGRMAFQVPIQVPKERFRVYKDELATKPKDILAAYETLKNIPVGVDFTGHRLIGIVGGKNKTGALQVVRDLLVQIAAGNCYTDVKIAIAYSRENGYEADCLREARWLPHTWSEDKKIRYIADTPEEADDVFYELARVLRNRDEEAGSFSAQKEELPKPWYILIVTDPAFLEGEILAKYVYGGEKHLGLSTILLAENQEDLPNACEFIIQNDPEFQGFYQVTDNITDRVPVRFDEVKPGKFGRFARRLSDIEVRETEKGGEIPSSLTFFEMLGVKSLKELDVLSGWRKNRTYDSMKALVGQKAGSAPCYLDIHEKYHGPHGLVAGTTGSGKSETLQTYILSLAINFSPDDVGFFIIDYKGGGMANLFSDLPHTIGQISNLSGNQVHRAMVSIKSENRRRQQIFNEHGVNNINNYTRLYKNNEATVPVPHLFIVIDEFAELKREEPDFMRELISVAQVGRSLGVHLILATQKPSGTVDDNIWSNAKFRLCLRVQDKQDSNDMLHKPDAAFITQAGRCYLQVGNDEIYELFQSGFSGAVYDDSPEAGKTEIAGMYSISGRAAIVGNRTKIRRKEKQRLLWISAILDVFRTLLAQGRRLEEILEDSSAEEAFLDQVFAEMEARELDYPVNEYNRRRLEDLLVLYAEVAGYGAGMSDRERGGRPGLRRLDYVSGDGTGTSDGEEGRSGLRRPENVSGYGVEVPDREAQAVIRLAGHRGKKLPETKEKTQLDAVVEYLAALARENGYNNRFTLWMPVLPETLYLNQLKGYTQNSFDGESWPVQEGPWKLEAYIGLLDDPVNQAQMPLMLNLSEGGNHAICGTVVTGKSTFLQSMVYSMTHSYTPDYVNFYLLDFSSHMLGAFEGLAHVGGVIYENDMEKPGKFFHMIGEIMEERKKLLQGGSYAQYIQAHGVVLPAIVIVIDQFSNFREKTGGIYEDTLIRISRNGAGYGIYLVMTAAGFGIMEIPNRIGDNVRTVLSLEMSDRYQYADVLHTLRVSVYPESGVKGRGLALRDGTVLEFQTALCVEAQDDYTRTEKIAAECRRMNEKWKGRRARRIPEIPENPVIPDFLELEETAEHLTDDEYLPLGYNQENATVYSIDLRRTFCYLIQGKARSGKTNVLRLLIAEAAQKGADVAIVDFGGTMKRTAQKYNARCLQNAHELANYWKELLPDIQKRNKMRKEAVAQELDDGEIYEKMKGEKAYFLFIDDLTEFVKCIYGPVEPEDNMKGFMENITEKARLMRIYLFAAFNPDKATETVGFKVFENMVRQKNGVHLGGNVSAQRYLDFDYIPFSEQSRVYKPGTGLLPAVDGEVPVKAVVIPLDRRKA